MKVVVLLLFAAILTASAALAELQLDIDSQSTYNLGDSLAISGSIKADETGSGFASLLLECDEIEIPFYTVQVAVDANQRTSISIPDLTLTAKMVGSCFISGEFSHDNGDQFSANTRDFGVSDAIFISYVAFDPIKPGTVAPLEFDVSKENGKSVTDEKAVISFQGTDTEVPIDNGKVTYDLFVPYETSAGEKNLAIKVEDEAKNKGDALVPVEVLAIPTRIKYTINKTSYRTGDELQTVVTLLDHTDAPIPDANISVAFNTKRGKTLTEAPVPSTKYIIVPIDASIKPGEYILASSYDSIELEQTITIEETESVQISSEGTVLRVVNTGNVDYRKELELEAVNDETQKRITKKLRLKPGTEREFDLSKEVPSGVYDISLLNFGLSATDDRLLKNIAINDDRSTFKKSFQGMSAISGAAVAAAETVFSKGALSIAVMVIIVAAIALHFFRRRPPTQQQQDNTERLFNDYQFKDNGTDKP